MLRLFAPKNLSQVSIARYYSSWLGTTNGFTSFDIRLTLHAPKKKMSGMPFLLKKLPTHSRTKYISLFQFFLDSYETVT